MGSNSKNRQRVSFGKIPEILDPPDLIDIQRKSFEWFIREGLREALDDVSPIQDYAGNLALEFGDYKFEPIEHDIEACKQKRVTYGTRLSLTVRFINKKTNQITQQDVFIPEFP